MLQAKRTSTARQRAFKTKTTWRAATNSFLRSQALHQSTREESAKLDQRNCLDVTKPFAISGGTTVRRCCGHIWRCLALYLLQMQCCAMISLWWADKRVRQILFMECLLLRVHWLPFEESCAIGALVWFAAHSDRGGSLGQSWSVLSKCTLRFSWIKPKLRLCRSLFISNISFHTPYFSCGKPHALIFLLFIVSIRAKKCCHASYTPKAFSKVILCQKPFFLIFLVLLFFIQFQVNTKNASNKFVYGFTHQHVYARSSLFWQSIENSCFRRRKIMRWAFSR